MHDLQMGVIDISESEWPSFLYPQGTSWDLDDDKADLFRGYLLLAVSLFYNICTKIIRLICLLWVFRQIFTGPRTATDPGGAKKGRASKSRLHNLTEVTPRTIAYTCVIVSLKCFINLQILALTFNLETRITLRGKGWTVDDGAFEYGVFYQNIVRMFESDPDDEWAKETLDWWNE